MKKKLQVFVSSTYTDLLSERQAVVEAILMSGNIPAGMELFAAGNASQLETIRRWIKESDVFMLILGGRYGSIEETTGKSYTQLEFEYAIELNKPLFSAVISETHLDQKVKAEGKAVLEQQHQELYANFRKAVLGRMCKFFDDAKDLKLAVHESVPEVTRERNLPGWVRGDEIIDSAPMLAEMNQLRTENSNLTKTIGEFQKRLIEEDYNGYTFDNLRQILLTEKIALNDVAALAEFEESSLLELFVTCAGSLNVGIDNRVGMNESSKFLFYKLAPKLAVYGLVEKRDVGKVGVQRFQTSKSGNRFLARLLPTLNTLIASNRQGSKNAKNETLISEPPKKKAKRKPNKK